MNYVAYSFAVSILSIVLFFCELYELLSISLRNSVGLQWVKFFFCVVFYLFYNGPLIYLFLFLLGFIFHLNNHFDCVVHFSIEILAFTLHPFNSITWIFRKIPENQTKPLFKLYLNKWNGTFSTQTAWDNWFVCTLKQFDDCVKPLAKHLSAQKMLFSFNRIYELFEIHSVYTFLLEVFTFYCRGICQWN